MGCFLACFGFSKKRRRRKPSSKVLDGDQGHGNYQPLDSSVPVNVDIREDTISSEIRDKPKERPGFKIRKKVSFNLDVQTYEPIPSDYHLLESDKEEEEEKKCNETAKGGLNPAISKGGVSELTKSLSYPSNYRYQNCRDSYDEETEMAFEEIDLDDDDDPFDDYCDDYDGKGDDEFCSDNDILHDHGQVERLESSYMESPKRVALPALTKNETINVMAACASNVRELKSLKHQNVRDRSQYVHPVLNPIENLSQWKAVKARAAPPMYQRKENMEFKRTASIPSGLKPNVDPSPYTNLTQSKPPMEEIAVDTSLSNWLFLPKSNRSETTTRCS